MAFEDLVEVRSRGLVWWHLLCAIALPTASSGSQTTAFRRLGRGYEPPRGIQAEEDVGRTYSRNSNVATLSAVVRAMTDLWMEI
jgi:hypothetical protein